MRLRLTTRCLAALLGAVLACGPSLSGQSPQTSAPAPAKVNSAELEKKARKLADGAQEAAAAGNWEQAFQLYSQASQQMPGVGEYLMKRETARFQVVQQCVDRAERAALAGQFDAARTELQRALALDPAYPPARQRLAQLLPRQKPAAAFQSALPELQPRPGTRSFDVRGDTRKAFEEVGRQFGLTVSFDPDLRSRDIRFRVADVDFATTMKLLSRQTGTFWRVLDAHAFLVADDTPQKRRELEAVIVRTIPLSGLASPEQATEIVRMVREIAGISATQLDTRTNTLTVRDTPEAVALAMQLVAELEQAVGELMLEVEILEVDRDLARRLGVTPPSSARTFTITPSDIREAQASPEGLLRVIQRVFGGAGGLGGVGTGQSTLGPLIPPLIAIGGGNSVILATLPGATADFAETFSALRGARRMMLRAQDGQQSTFFIGERFPIAFSVLSPNFAGVNLGNITGGNLDRTDFETGDGPAAVASADLDADGNADVVVANANSDSISVFLGDGTGDLGTRSDVPVGISPSAVVALDLNADGRADIAVANEDSDTVTVLMGNGDGTFAAGVDFSAGNGPRGLVAADFNGDLLPDLATANAAGDSVTILLNDGSGGFLSSSEIPVGDRPRALVAVNLNANAALDLAVANEGSDSISLLFGNGDGTFTPGVGFQTSAAPVAVASADVNTDGFADLIIANNEDDTVSVVLGEGNGTFSTITDYAAGDGPTGVVVTDFTADGRLDLAVSNQNGDTFTILLGVGDGTFALNTNFQAGDGPAALIAPDLTNDGRRDLVIANRDADTISVIINQASISPVAPFGPQSVQPYPGFQYEDLGLKVIATPRLHPGGEVTLQLQIEIRSRTGADLNGIPVISNRTLEQSVRLKENQPTVLTGIIQRGDTLGVSGWPGLARIPATGRRDRNDSETELIISVTPRRLRLADRIDKQYYAGRETSGSRGVTAPQ